MGFFFTLLGTMAYLRTAPKRKEVAVISVVQKNVMLSVSFYEHCESASTH